MKFRKVPSIVYSSLFLLLTGCFTVDMHDGFSHLSTDETGLLIVKSHRLAKEAEI